MIATLAAPIRGIRTRRRTRGTVMLEFVLLMPLFILFIVFTINVSHAVMVRTQMQVVADNAARAGAQVGGGCYRAGDFTGNPGSQCTLDVAEDPVSLAAVVDGLGTIAGVGSATQDDNGTDIRVISGGRCERGGEHDTVRVKVQIPLTPALPGIGQLLSLYNSGDDSVSRQWNIAVQSAARCEIVR